MEKKAKKEAKEEKQKDQKLEEQVLKSLDEENAKTPEEKFQALIRKHVDSERASRRLQQDLKTQEKQLETVLREKENLQREYNKSILMRDKLQEVCREQQKIIKSVKNESVLKTREADERRKECQAKFQGSLNEITQSLTANHDENMKLRQHNIDMTKKLKCLAEQTQTRELQLEKLNEQVQLEAQLHQAKMNKVQVEAAMEKEILTKEKQIALEKLLHTQKALKDLALREAALKEQLNLYTAKYDDFQVSLQKSNDIFATYKTELEKMSKNTKKLERESLEWKRKCERNNATVIELATEKKDRDDHVIRCNKQVDQLQKLLRALQHERTHLYKVMREQNVEIPELPTLPPEPELINTATVMNTNTDKDKMELMSRNCAELKETLANLQNQMKFLNLKSATSAAMTQAANGSPAASVSSKTPAQLQQQAEKKRQKRKQKIKGKNATTNNGAGEETATTTPTESATPESVTKVENEGDAVDGVAASVLNSGEEAVVIENGSEEAVVVENGAEDALPHTVGKEVVVENGTAEALDQLIEEQQSANAEDAADETDAFVAPAETALKDPPIAAVIETSG